MFHKISFLALPEDAEELSYVEECDGDQYDSEANATNTWNITTCPSILFLKTVANNILLFI